MDAIPTPRVDAFEILIESEDFDVELARTKILARQLERELTIAKKALEVLADGDWHEEQIAQKALDEMNNLSA